MPARQPRALELTARRRPRKFPPFRSKESTMKIGMITDRLGNMSFDEVLKTSAEVGIQMLEFACGNWSSAPHVQLDKLLGSDPARKEFLAKVKDHGITISALNC